MNRVDSFATVVSIHAVQFREKSGGKWPILNLSADDIYIYNFYEIRNKQREDRVSFILRRDNNNDSRR